MVLQALLGSVLFVVAALGAAARPAAAQPNLQPAVQCSRIDLLAELSSSMQWITGSLTCHAQNSGTLYLARFPQLLKDTSDDDELTARRVYPSGFDAASMTLQGPKLISEKNVDVGGEGLWQAFGSVEAHQPVTVYFRTKVPERLGTFGLHEGTATLLGGWHPIVGSGFSDRPSMQHTLIHYRVTVPEQRAGFVGVHRFGKQAARQRVGIHRGTMVPMLVAHALHVHAHAPSKAILVAPRARNATVYGRGDVTAATDAEAHKQALLSAAMAQAFLRQAEIAAVGGLPNASPPSTPLPFVVVVPLRERLSESFEGGVAISDRAFHLLPIETLRRFHRASLWREWFNHALLKKLPLSPLRKATHGLLSLPRELYADALAAALTERLLAATGALAYAPELLEKFSVSPAVDQLIFAPQIPFPEVFYNAVDESRVSGVRFDSMLAPLPRGKILYEKLKDLVGGDRALHILLKGLNPQAPPLEERLQQALGHEASVRLMAWLGPYPALDYALAAVRSEPQKTQCEVTLNGPDAAQIIEPITVALTDRNHQNHTQTRMGPGTLTFTAPGPARAIEVDPAQRLVEKCHPKRVQARYNNREPKRFRVLLNDLSATLDVSGRALTAGIDLLGRRIYDLRRDMHLGASFGPYSFGVQAGLAEHFGKELTPLRLAQTISLNASFLRLRGLRGTPSPPGRLASLSLGYRYDTRKSRLMALKGSGLDAIATFGLTALADAHHVQPWSLLGASVLHILPLWGRQALLLRLRFDNVVGIAPPQVQPRLGGRYLGARGFQIGEAFGPKRLLASSEYRHVLVGDSRTDIFGLATLTSVEGALFGDAIFMPHLRPANYGRLLGDVGYGVRVMGDVLGASPATLALDIALPIGRRSRTLSAVTVYVAFVQSFLAF